jgi:hypothetical protein
MDAQNGLSSRSGNSGIVLLGDLASKPIADAKTCCICHDKCSPDPVTVAEQLTGGTKEPSTYSLTASLRANVKIVDGTSPNRIIITRAADKGLTRDRPPRTHC